MKTRFIQFIADFKKLWDKIESAKNIPGIIDILKEMYGENTSTNSLIEQSGYILNARNSSQSGVARQGGLITGLASTSAIVKPKNGS